MLSRFPCQAAFYFASLKWSYWHLSRFKQTYAMKALSPNFVFLSRERHWIICTTVSFIKLNTPFMPNNQLFECEVMFRMITRLYLECRWKNHAQPSFIKGLHVNAIFKLFWVLLVLDVASEMNRTNYGKLPHIAFPVSSLWKLSLVREFNLHKNAFLYIIVIKKTFLNYWVVLFLSTSLHKNKKVNVICTFVTDIMTRLYMYLFVKASLLPFGFPKHRLWQLINHNVIKPSRNLRDFSSSWTGQ